jgi:hypothetical protein
MTKEERKEYDKQYYLANKEKLKEYNKQYRLDNKKKKAEYDKQYRLDNKKKKVEYEKQWRLDNKEKIKQYNLASKEKNKQWRLDNKKKKAEYDKQYRLHNKDKIKQWRLDNKEKTNQSARQRKKTDPLFKLAYTCRNRMLNAFKSKGINKDIKSEKMLGCTYKEMQQHLINQFTEGMTVDNHGKWHIDHIIPLTLANTKEELIELIHYTNLQPLWAFDNISKKDKIIMEYVSKENSIRYKKFIDRYNSI